jgi:hypothetical protein
MSLGVEGIFIIISRSMVEGVHDRDKPINFDLINEEGNPEFI